MNTLEFARSVAADELLTEEERLEYLASRRFGRNEEVAAAVVAEIRKNRLVNTKAKMDGVYRKHLQQFKRRQASSLPFDLSIFLATHELSRVESVREQLRRVLVQAKPKGRDEAERLVKAERRKLLGMTIQECERVAYVNQLSLSPAHRIELLARVSELTSIAKLDFAATRLVTGAAIKSRAPRELVDVSVFGGDIQRLSEEAAKLGQTVDDVLGMAIPSTTFTPEMSGFQPPKFEEREVRRMSVALTRKQQAALKAASKALVLRAHISSQIAQARVLAVLISASTSV